MDGIGSGRVVAGVLLVGAVLATIGNAMHPFLDAGASVEELLVTIGSEGTWQLLHLTITLAVVLGAAGIAAVCRGLAHSAGASLATLASVFAVVGGTAFAIQIGAVDGATMPVLADALAAAEDPTAVLAVAEAVWAFDQALLGIVVTVYFGALFLAFGLAMVRARAFASWIRAVAVVAGGAGLATGPLMVLGIGGTTTFLAFRAVAVAATVVTFGVAVQLWRGTALPGSPGTLGRPLSAAASS